MFIAHTIFHFVAMWPHYIEGEGSGSRLITFADELLTDKHGTRSLLRKLLQKEGIDLTLYRKAMAELTPGKLSLPIVVRDFVFMTFKARKARVRGDETYGYARTDMVKEIKEVRGFGEIILMNGMKLPTMEKVSTLYRHMSEAALVYAEQKKRRGNIQYGAGYYSLGQGFLNGFPNQGFAAYSQLAATAQEVGEARRCCPRDRCDCYGQCGRERTTAAKCTVQSLPT